MQCKDIADAPLLRFIATKQADKGYWVNTWDFEPPYSNLPDNLFRAKMGQLLKRRLIDGCNCGCRGDYELTDRGRDYLEWDAALDALSDLGSDDPKEPLTKRSKA